MTDKPPPQWAIDKASSLPDVVKLQTIYVDAKLINAIAALLVQERERCAEICEEIMGGLEAYPWYGLLKIAVAKIRQS